MQFPHDIPNSPEFPLIEDGWDGEADADPEKAEPYAGILVVVMEGARPSSS